MSELVPLLVAAAAFLASLGTALYVTRSRPVVARAVLDDLLDRVSRVERDQHNATLAWDAYRIGIDGLLEEMRETEERTKRNRRKTTQAAAKLQREEGNGHDRDESPEALRGRARAMGIAGI